MTVELPNGFLNIMLAGYLLGSIPVGRLVRLFRASRWASMRIPRALDNLVRRVLAPVFRALPPDWVETIMAVWPIAVGNFAKGMAAVLLAQQAIGTSTPMVFTGVAAVWGHTWPIWLGFRSERGTAVILGASTVLAPVVMPLWVSVWVMAFALLKFSSLASLVSFAIMPALMWGVTRRDVYTMFGVVCGLIALGQLFPDLQRVISGRVKRADEGGPLTETDFEDEEEKNEKIRLRRLKVRAMLGALGMLISLFWFANKYVYRGFGLQVPIIRSGGPYHKIIALTFDDGPDPVYTPQILDVLKEHNAKATFFLVGKHVEKYPDIAKRIANEGHDIGNHSYSHPNMVLLTRDRLIREVEMAEKAITQAAGVRPYLFRPPRGLHNKALMEIIIQRKYTMVLWSLSSRDWQEPSHKEIVWRVLRGARNGDIVLFHDSGSIISPEGGCRQSTVLALPEIIKGLRAQGFKIVTIRDMIILSDLDGQIQ